MPSWIDAILKTIGSLFAQKGKDAELRRTDFGAVVDHWEALAARMDLQLQAADARMEEMEMDIAKLRADLIKCHSDCEKSRREVAKLKDDLEKLRRIQ